MKKYKYIKPQTDIVAVNFQQHLLAGSNEIGEENINLNPENMSGGDGGDASSRGGFFWDDED